MPRPWHLIFITMLALLIPACRQDAVLTEMGQQRDAETADSSAAAGSPDRAEWPFWPTQMRVHPATRTAPDPKTSLPVIEARIEFRDQEGTVTRASGQIRVDLHKGRSPLGDPIGTWNLDLRDLTINRERFDDITRTYLLRLETRDLTIPPRCVIKVYFLSADGRTLTAEHELRPPA